MGSRMGYRVGLGVLENGKISCLAKNRNLAPSSRYTNHYQSAILATTDGVCGINTVCICKGKNYLYRVSQEERTKLREGVPYVKLYRYNPKHLCPKLNGYWDNGQIKLRTSFGSTNDSRQLVSVICICSPVRHTNCWRSPEMHIPAYVRQAGRQAGWRHRSAFQCDV